MNLTRENVIELLSETSGYYKKDIRYLLQCLDEVVFEEFSKMTPDEEVSIQVVKGCKLICAPVKERERKDPRTQKDITCSSTCRLKAKFSQDLKMKMAAEYDKRHNNKNG